jgi:hypothetical protein
MLIDGQYHTLTVDKATARRTTERGAGTSETLEWPIIPASAIKGAMRIEFERLMRALERPVCQGPDPKKMCATEPCIVCRLFGGPGNRPSQLRFTDALPPPGQYRELYVQRMGVALSRSLRRAESGLLFSQEAMPPGLRLETRIEALTPLQSRDRQDFETVLRWWEGEGLAIGGGRSRGMGRVTLEWEVEDIDAATGHPEVPAFMPQRRSRLFQLRFTPTTETEEPLRVGTIKLRTYFLGSQSFIPGNTVRGAVGWRLSRGGMPEEDISNLLLRHEARFSHLYPQEPGPLDMPPASAVQCKKEENHSPYDHLLWQFVLGKMVEHDIAASKLLALHERTTHCLVPGCESELKPVPRFQRQKRRLQIKLALDRTLGRQEAGMFYIYETLSGDQAYEGLVWADEGLRSVIEEQGLSVLLGGGRSKGFGGGQLQLEEYAGDLGDAGKVEGRLEQLREALEQRLYAALDEPEAHATLDGRLFFTLTLLTELALPPSVTLADWLRDTYGWAVETAYLHWTRLGGYSQAGNRSKPLVQALEQGGVLLLSAPAEERTPVLDGLSQMEREGLGLLCDQGYGWVYACHPYHYEEAIPVEGIPADG